MSVFTVVCNVSFVSDFEPKPERIIVGTFSSEQKALEAIDNKVYEIVQSLIKEGDTEDTLYEECYEDMFTIIETKLDDSSKFEEITSSTYKDSFLVY